MNGEWWFKASREAIADVFGEDADLYSKILAATSPLMTIESNVTIACRVYRQLKVDGEVARGGLIHVHYVTMAKLLNGGHGVGRKVWALYQNLIGNEMVCPVDRWVLRAFGYEGNRYVSEKLYDAIEGAIIKQAAERGITPAQRQVEIWCEQRGRATNYGEILKRREIRRDNLVRRLL